MRFACLIAVCFLCLASYVLANNESSAYFQESEEQYQCLLRGSGVIEPPYEEDFQFLLVYQPEPGYLHFTFDHPLDPSQQGELLQYGAQHDVLWSVCYFELEGHAWSVVTTLVTGEPQELARVFLSHLSHLSFIWSLSPLGTQEQVSR